MILCDLISYITYSSSSCSFCLSSRSDLSFLSLHFFSLALHPPPPSLLVPVFLPSLPFLSPPPATSSSLFPRSFLFLLSFLHSLLYPTPSPPSFFFLPFPFPVSPPPPSTAPSNLHLLSCPSYFHPPYPFLFLHTSCLSLPF